MRDAQQGAMVAGSDVACGPNPCPVLNIEG
jgi:hypothetical protein